MSLDRIRDPRGIRHREGHMEADYIYTAGRAGERFFAALRDEGKLLATRCEKCGVTYMPPRVYCERCFSRLETWVEAKRTGVVETFTVVHEDRDGEPLPEPEIVAFIKIDGTDGGLIHRIGEAKPESLRIGMRVEAVLKPPKERSGALTDIVYFKPA